MADARLLRWSAEYLADRLCLRCEDGRLLPVIAAVRYTSGSVLVQLDTGVDVLFSDAEAVRVRQLLEYHMPGKLTCVTESDRSWPS